MSIGSSRSKITLPEVTEKGSLCYPVDKKGEIISTDAGYHSFELLTRDGVDDELAMAVMGVYGSTRRILNGDFACLPGQAGHAYQRIEIHGSRLVAHNGATEYDLGAWPPGGLEV